jgi:hypothetical protein
MTTAPLVNLSELKAELADSNSTERDGIYRRLVLQATLNVESFIRKTLTRGGRIEFLSTADYAKPLHLETFAIDASEPLEVHYASSGRFSPNTALSLSDYEIDADRGVLRLLVPTVRSTRSVKVSYVGGYEPIVTEPDGDAWLARAPEALRLAGFYQALYLEKRMNRLNIGFEKERTESKTGVMAQAQWESVGGLVPQAADLCAPYRRILTGRS